MNKIGFRFTDGDGALKENNETGLDSSIDLSYILAALRRRRALIIAPMMVWILLGVVYTITTPRFYDAAATVLLDQNIDQAIQQVSNTTALTLNNSAMESARLVITSDQVADKVARELQLQLEQSFLDPPVSLLSQILGTGMSYIRRPLGWLRLQFADKEDPNAPAIDAKSLTSEQVETAFLSKISDALQSELNVYRLGQSSAFQISYRSHSPDLAARIVNGFADVYVSDTLNANFEATERMTEWMQGRLTQLETDARISAQAAERFRAENGLVSNRESTISQDAVSRLNEDLSESIAQAARARAQVAALTTALEQDGNLRLSALPTIEDDVFTSRQRILGTAITNAERMNSRLPEDDPRVIQAEKNVSEAAARLLISVQRLLEQSRGDQLLAEAKVSALRDSLAEAVSADVDSGSAMVQLRTLEQRAQTLSTLYQTFLAKFQEVDQQKNFPISNVRVLNQAQSPEFASGPRTSKTLAFCILLGLFTGFILVAISEWRDRFLRTAEQVRSELKMPFLGYLPNISVVTNPKHREGGQEALGHVAKDGKLVIPPGSPLYAMRFPRSHYTETLRGIRLSSELSGPANNSRVLGITSAQPGEGKTVTSLNVATVISASGASVVLVDMDVHRSGMTRMLGMQHKAGLLQVLTGLNTVSDVVCSVPLTNVDFIPCSVPEEFYYASELLSNDTLHAMLAELRKQYDYVIVDLAPMAPVIDVRMVLSSLDQLIMVTEWGKTKKSLVHNLLTSDPELQKKLLGIVLTNVDLNRLGAYISDDDANANLASYQSYVDVR